MSDARKIKRILTRQPTMEGAGVHLNRVFGYHEAPTFDPFLMLDHFSSDNPDDYIAGFPDHPHRGFITFTYMLDGHMEHRDSMGNRGDLRAGGVQWMRAGSGVIHSEMPSQTNGLMRGFQLWINLPAAEKMSSPAYQEFDAQMIPQICVGDALVKVLSGHFSECEGPVKDDHTEMLYLDVELPASSRFDLPLQEGMTGFLYPFEGTVVVEGVVLPTHNLGVLGSGDRLEANTTDEAARFILVAGRPLNEPILQHGPFVMSSREEIEHALRDYRDGILVRERAGGLAV